MLSPKKKSEVSWFMGMNLCACIICLRQGLNDSAFTCSSEPSRIVFDICYAQSIDIRDKVIFEFLRKTNKGKHFYYLSGRTLASVHLSLQETVRKKLLCLDLGKKISTCCFSILLVFQAEIFIYFTSSVNILNQTTFCCFSGEETFFHEKIEMKFLDFEEIFYSERGVEKRMAKKAICLWRSSSLESQIGWKVLLKFLLCKSNFQTESNWTFQENEVFYVETWLVALF